MKLLLFGASGSGTTTLGKELERITHYKHLDVDDYFWKLTDPPFQEKTPIEERNHSLIKDVEKYKDVILSGSLASWGPYWLTAFDLAIFLYLPADIRMDRLEKREKIRNKHRVNKALSDSISQAFLEWAKQYDDPDFTGRSLRIHLEWLNLLQCPVLRIEGNIELDERINTVLDGIHSINQ